MLTAMTMNDIERELMQGSAYQGQKDKTRTPASGIIQQLEVCLAGISSAHDSVSALNSKISPILSDSPSVACEKSLMPDTSSALGAMLADLHCSISGLNARLIEMNSRVDL